MFWLVTCCFQRLWFGQKLCLWLLFLSKNTEPSIAAVLFLGRVPKIAKSNYQLCHVLTVGPRGKSTPTGRFFLNFDIRMFFENLKNFQISWKSVKNFQVSWKSVKKFQVLWKSVKHFQVLWKSGKNFQVSWKSGKNFQVSWRPVKNFQVSWKSDKKNG